MKKATARIKVDAPCTENWDGMQPNASGRHCEKCAKTVVDFTAVPDHNIVAYLRQHKNTCGRFYAHQLEREIPFEAGLLSKAKLWRNWSLAGLFAFQFWPRPSHAQVVTTDSTKAPDPQQINLQNNVLEIKGSIRGRVVQPDTLAQRAKQLRFTIDTFTIAIDVDSAGIFNFQYPLSMPSDTIYLDVIAEDEAYSAKQLLLFKSSLGLEQVLVFNQKWTCTYQLSFKLPEMVWGPPIIMGGGWPQVQWPQIQWPVVWVDTTLSNLKLVTVGDTVIADANEKQSTDPSFGDRLRKQKEAFLQQRKANRLKGWLWVLLPLVLVMAMVKWVSRPDASAPSEEEDEE